MPKKKRDVFSVVKAVKENARTRIGTPPPSVTIPNRRHKAEHGPVKHKKPPTAAPDGDSSEL